MPLSRTSSGRRGRTSPPSVVAAQVGQRLGVLAGQRRPGRRAGPRAAATQAEMLVREGLAEERAERHVLPGLDVARAPVVEQHDAEEVVVGLVDADPGADRGRAADDEAELGLDVEPHARAEDRRGVGRRLALAAGPDDVGAADHDGAGAAVVADRQVLPVRRQRLAVRAEDPADVGGVLLAGVEVDVVGHLERQVQRHLGQRQQVRLDGVAVGGVGEHVDEPARGPRPRRAGRATGSRSGSAGSSMAPDSMPRVLGGGAGVQHLVADPRRRPGAGPGRRWRTRRTAGCRGRRGGRRAGRASWCSCGLLDQAQRRQVVRRGR